MSALALRAVTVAYGDVVALQDVSLTVEPGERVGVLGPNGAGKSTLLRAAVGLAELNAGTVTVFGRPAGQDPAAVAYLPQRSRLDWDYPAEVAEVVAMGRYPRRGTWRRLRASDREAVALAIAEVDLADLARRRIDRLSGGQQQRMLVARALCQQAPLMLLDEPFAGVDPATEARLDEVLDRAAAGGTAVVTVHHDLARAAARHDRLVLLDRQVQADGPPREVLAARFEQAGILPSSSRS